MEILVAVNDARAAFHLRLGGEAATALAGDFVTGCIGVVMLVCHTASGVEGGGVVVNNFG